MTHAPLKELNQFRREIAALDDVALVTMLQTLCKELPEVSPYSSPDEHVLKQIIPQRQKIDQLYFEFASRGRLEKYADVYARTFRKQRANLTITRKAQRDAVFEAHCSYMWPRSKDIVELIRAIDRYTDSSGAFNSYLRGHEKMTDIVMARIKMLDKAMRPLPQEIEVHRGFSLPYNHAALKAGDIYRDKGYLCTTAKRAMASSYKGAYLMDLIVPAGTPYVSSWKGAARNNSYVRAEQEIVIGRGQRIYITEVKQMQGYKRVRGRIVTAKEIREGRLKELAA